ncbi:50S ribosomal protein L29 [Candidatus Saccharibacteria bacterium]|nr:50S ribosomal protein L29 [Candidatus Saccharibacteria bacterium]MCB9821549.1 50S ribosomal protein L29 [Candidatus Nomurabacteria bacterium]
MADKKSTTKTTEPVAKDSQSQLLELRKTLNEQIRSQKSGTATNMKAARATRKQIARLMTEINKQKGERS